MDKALEKRIERAHILHAAGHGTSEIAQQYQVTTRTVRRWLSTTIDDATMEAIELGSREDIEKFAANAWRITHRLLEQVEERLDSGEFKAKDLAVSLGILLDKVRQISPQTVEEETETVKTVFEMYCPAKEEQRARELFETWKAQYLEGKTVDLEIEDGQQENVQRVGLSNDEFIEGSEIIKETVEEADIEEAE